MTKDEEHLKALSICHYVFGALGCFFALLPLIYLVLGLVVIFYPEKMIDNHGETVPVFLGWIFIVIGVLLFFIGEGLAISIILSGKFLASRKRYVFSFVLGCISCIFFPFGTVLGIFTIVVLSRESVKQLYEKTQTMKQMGF